MTGEEIRREEARCEFLTSVVFDMAEEVYRDRRWSTDAELAQMQRISLEIIRRRRDVNAQKTLHEIGFALGNALVQA